MVSKAAAGRQFLFRRHDRAQSQHPANAARADNKHQKHQAPTAADARDSVSDAEQQGLPFVPCAAPMLGNKAQRRPARASRQRYLSALNW